MNEQTGLIYCEECAWQGEPSIDCESGPDHWEIGFEIIYRPELGTTDRKVIEKLKTVFMKPFNLPDEYYSFEPPSFWRIYWDRGILDVALLKECEKGMDKVARDNNTVVKLHPTLIQPRSLNYIRQHVEYNRHKSSG